MVDRHAREERIGGDCHHDACVQRRTHQPGGRFSPVCLAFKLGELVPVKGLELREQGPLGRSEGRIEVVGECLLERARGLAIGQHDAGRPEELGHEPIRWHPGRHVAAQTFQVGLQEGIDVIVEERSIQIDEQSLDHAPDSGPSIGRM